MTDKINISNIVKMINKAPLETEADSYEKYGNNDFFISPLGQNCGSPVNKKGLKQHIQKNYKEMSRAVSRHKRR